MAYQHSPYSQNYQQQGYPQDDPYQNQDGRAQYDDQQYSSQQPHYADYSADHLYQSYGSREDDQKSYYSHQSRVNLVPNYRQESPYNEKSYDESYSKAPPSPIGMPRDMHPFPQRPAYNPDYGAQSSYSQAKEKLLKRRSVRHVELQHGNLVLDCPVAQSILTYAKIPPGSTADEFKTMRYTAVTHDPDQFMSAKYSLRPFLYGRKTELFVVITAYNEDEVLLERSLTSAIKNISHLQGRNKSKMWGANAWQKVVICVIADGRTKVHPRFLKLLGLYGVFQDGVMKDTVAGRDTQAHIFEYSTQVHVDSSGNVNGGIAPVQLMFCLKEQNKKKLNSHRWFFNAFSAQLQPNVCILIDAGTKPSATSFYHLWKVFDSDHSVGGACGEITVDTGRGCVNLLNPLVAAQNFEYKMSNILDKPLESIFGYISVLPGAFSAYRYKALAGRPLQTYFRGETLHEDVKAGLFESNMFLAEDRILCFEIVTKRDAAWLLRYVKAAKASTDVPNTVAEFIGQRRRWLNGSFFASIHATFGFYRLFTSGHNPFRKIWLMIESIYNLVQLFFTWFALANFYLAFFFVTTSATADSVDDQPFGDANTGQDIVAVLQKVYIGLLFTIIVCALGNRPQGSRFAYMTCILTFAVIFGVALYSAAWTIYLSVPHTAEGWSDFGKLLNDSTFRDIVLSLGATYGLYLVASILHLEPWHMFTSFIQYMFLLPSFVNILSIYSMSNLHDISWGTKGQSTAKDLGSAKTGKDGKVEVELPTAKEDIDSMFQHMRRDLAVKPPEKKEERSDQQKQTDHYANFRTNLLLVWLGSNLVVVIFFSSTFWLNLAAKWSISQNADSDVVTNPYNTFIFWSVMGLSAFRAVGSCIYLVLQLLPGH